MKNTASTLLLATLLAAPVAFAQDAAPAAEEATAEATAEVAAPAAEATAEVAAPADVAPIAEAVDAPVVAEVPATDAPATDAPATDAPADAPVVAEATVVDASALPADVVAIVGAPAAGKGRIVFFRPKNFVGSMIGFIVRENETELGKLRNGNWFALDVEPGAHAYVVHSEAKDVTNLEIEDGETYFVSASISMGMFAGRPNLTPSDVGAFQVAMPKLKPSKELK